MTEVPADTPVTIPVVDPTVAIEVAELDQVPPEVVLIHCSDDPIQIGVFPDMVWATGAVIVTVFVAVLTHPPMVTEYVIVAVPADTPVTVPFDEPTVAIDVAELVHVPPVVVLVQVWEEPIQIGVVPVIVCVTGAVMVTVFVAVLTQPFTVTE